MKAARNSAIGCACLLAVIEGVGIGIQRMMAENTRLDVILPLTTIIFTSSNTQKTPRSHHQPLHRHHPRWKGVRNRPCLPNISVRFFMKYIIYSTPWRLRSQRHIRRIRSGRIGMTLKALVISTRIRNGEGIAWRSLFLVYQKGVSRDRDKFTRLSRTSSTEVQMSISLDLFRTSINFPCGCCTSFTHPSAKQSSFPTLQP